MRFLYSYVSIMILLLFTAHQAFAQPINWDSVRSDYVKKYQPQQMPAWLFPIIFKEGGGQRDTVYLGYDEDAQDFGWPQSDTVFGEVKLAIDTSVFNASFTGFTNNTALKVAVWRDLSNGSSIECYKGILPLKMYWDREAFYSDSLPFTGTVSPKGMGYFYCTDGDPNYRNCNLFYPYYMTDDPLAYYSFWDSCVFTPPSSVPYLGPHPCYAIDSIVLCGNLPLGGGMSIEIVPYGSHITGIDHPLASSDQSVKLYPNPGDGNVTIGWSGDHPATFQLYNMQGRRILEGKLVPGTQHLNLRRFPPGIYLIEVVTIEGLTQTATYLLTR